MEIPQSLISSLKGIKGFNEEAFRAVHSSGRQVTSIRLNPFKQSTAQQQNIQSAIPWCEQAYYLTERPSFTLDPLFHAGAYYVQEASSMFLQYLLKQLTKENKESLKVLDLCAAPGGKSTLLAALFSNGLVVSNEVIKQRASILVENATKWGLPNMIVTNNDPDHFKQLESFFDIIVVDAPCSGSGLFRKDVAAISEWSEQNVLHCSERQERILAAIIPALKEDGLLIYSTCSYSPQEDEQIADWLVNEMGLASVSVEVPEEWNIIITEAPQTGAKGYRFYPNLLQGEGFYIAAFKKTTGFHPYKYKETNLTKPTRTETEQLNGYIKLTSEYQLFKQQDEIRAIALYNYTPLQQLAQQLYIKKAGVGIGALKGKDLIPSHELAVSLFNKSFFATVELNLEQSLQYLRRKELPIEAPKGWCLALFEGLPLGWMKVLPNRINNYYPAEWRILKD